jgi:hypothetical protein
MAVARSPHSHRPVRNAHEVRHSSGKGTLVMPDLSSNSAERSASGSEACAVQAGPLAGGEEERTSVT